MRKFYVMGMVVVRKEDRVIVSLRKVKKDR